MATEKPKSKAAEGSESFIGVTRKGAKAGRRRQAIRPHGRSPARPPQVRRLERAEILGSPVWQRLCGGSMLRVMSAPWRRRRRAASLIETLVCIAIISIMMSMLLPALFRARNNAVRMQCENNLYQID